MQNMDTKTALGLQPNVGALLCYIGNLVCSFGLIYSIIVVVTDKSTKLTRFHAFQSILLSVLGLVFGLVAAVAAIIAMAIDAALGFPILSLLIGLVCLVLGLAIFVTMIMAAVRAYQGVIYKIPLIGGLAEKWA